MRLLAVPLLLCLLGCRDYSRFTLPVLRPEPVAPSFAFRARQGPVIARGGAGEWDAVDVLNPAVAKRDNSYFLFYSGFDGRTWHTGLAVSPDGFSWKKSGRVLSPDPSTWEGSSIAANGAVLAMGGEFFYWFQAGPRENPQIGLARSPDGRRWQKHTSPVLRNGPRGSFDERGVADPYVLRAQDGRMYLFYLGQDRARRQRLGVARSLDGVQWEKSLSGPILELGEAGAFDENGLGEPAVWSMLGTYWMLYTGRDHMENRRLGLARSTDGIHWQKLPGLFEGAEPWNSKVICDPEVEVHRDRVRVWFGGGDVASPDENLHGQIGVGELSFLPPGGQQP